jgi:hypothetical protein
VAREQPVEGSAATVAAVFIEFIFGGDNRFVFFRVRGRAGGGDEALFTLAKTSLFIITASVVVHHILVLFGVKVTGGGLKIIKYYFKIILKY